MKKLLNESVEYDRYEIDEDTKSILSIFQEVLATTMKYTHGNGLNKRGAFKDMRAFKQYRDELKRFHNYPFARVMMKHVDRIQKELIDALNANRTNRKESKKDFSASLSKAKSALLANNPTAFISACRPFHNITDTLSVMQRPASDILATARNPFYIENPLIFQTTNFLRQFEEDEMEEVIGKDLNTFKWAYLRLPASAHADYQFLAYFIMELSDKPGSVSMSGTQVSKFFKIAFSDANYSDLLKNVESYLSSNNASLLPKIVEGMKQFPELVAANNKLCKAHARVYRGVALDDEERLSSKDIAQQDRARPLIATSISSHVAMRFALSYGHLEGIRGARTDGVLLEYDISDDGAVLDTTIFGGIFGESEILINPRRAKLVGAKTVYRDNDDED